MHKNCGIYKITNTTNNKVYIGSSNNLSKRGYTHFLSLKNNNHHCEHLQRSYNKHGKEFFKFEIIKEVEHNKDLLIWEQFYLNNYVVGGKIDYNRCYNIASIAGSNLGIVRSINHKEKNRLNHPGKRVMNLDTGETFDSIADAAKSCGIKVKSHISFVCMGKAATAGGYKWSYLDGKDLIGTTKFKIKGSKRVINLDTGIEFKSTVEAGRYYNIKSYTGIAAVCAGKVKTCGGFRWSYLGDSIK